MRSRHDGILIIGYGNMLRGDDAAGPRAARRLRRRGIPAIDAHQLTPELAETVSRAALVVFIDASVDAPPGEIRVTPVWDSRRAVVDHHAGPGGLLRLTRDVYGRAPKALLISIGADSFELGRPLSKAVARAVRRVVNAGLILARAAPLPRRSASA
jgi:hydrogenase maturation protease